MTEKKEHWEYMLEMAKDAKIIWKEDDPEMDDGCHCPFCHGRPPWIAYEEEYGTWP